MGCCTASLQEQAAFEKGSCTLYLLRWKFEIIVCWLKVLNWIKALHLFQNFVLSKKATYSHKPIASLSQSVITYCHQRNPLRICTKLHIRLCYAWSSQRFKSLPSILCEMVVCAKLVTWYKPVIIPKTPYRPAIWTVPGVQRVATLWATFGSFRRSEKNVKPFPFGNFRGFANLESAHTGGSCAGDKLNPCCFRNNPRPLRGISRRLSRHTGRLCYTYVTLWKNHLQK